MAPQCDGSKYAAVILAGGDGVRLRAFTHEHFGYHLPKQFCPLFEGQTLLEQTMRRVSLVVSVSDDAAEAPREGEELCTHPFGPKARALSVKKVVTQ
jgi:hypothetical protein